MVALATVGKVGFGLVGAAGVAHAGYLTYGKWKHQGLTDVGDLVQQFQEKVYQNNSDRDQQLSVPEVIGAVNFVSSSLKATDSREITELRANCKRAQKAGRSTISRLIVQVDINTIISSLESASKSIRFWQSVTWRDYLPALAATSVSAAGLIALRFTP